jgi:hypothetical protein
MHRAFILAASAPSLILKFVFSAIIRAFTMTIAIFCHLGLATERISRSKWAFQVDVMPRSSVRRSALVDQHHDGSTFFSAACHQTYFHHIAVIPDRAHSSQHLGSPE